MNFILIVKLERDGVEQIYFKKSLCIIENRLYRSKYGNIKAIERPLQ